MIIIQKIDNCYPQEKMIHAHKAGASAAMLSAYDLQGQLNYIYDGRKHNSLNIATVEVSISAYKDLKKPLKNGENVTVVLYPSMNTRRPGADTSQVTTTLLMNYFQLKCGFLGWSFLFLGNQRCS